MATHSKEYLLSEALIGGAFSDLKFIFTFKPLKRDLCDPFPGYLNNIEADQHGLIPTCKMLLPTVLGTSMNGAL